MNEEFDQELTEFVELQYTQRLAQSDLDTFVAALNDRWRDVRFALDMEFYSRAYADIEHAFGEYDLLRYLRKGHYDAIAAGLGFCAICHEMGPDSDYQRVLVDGILCVYMAILDDINYDAAIDLRDIIYPFDPEIRTTRHRHFVEQTRALLTSVFAALPAPWSDLIVDIHNITYLSYYNEQFIQRKPITFYVYNYYRMSSIAIPYTNVLKGYLEDRADWYTHSGLLRLKCFEVETTLLLGYAQDLVSTNREEALNEVTNLMRLVDPCDDPMSLILRQTDLMLRRYDELKPDEFAEFLFRQIKLMFAWYLVSQRYFDHQISTTHRKLLADLDVEIPGPLVDLRTV
ncbi:hypothetical protein [Amycolatopsis nigrescens]|uniref:hypothetical protein n=1 Tax=Amycolatopsis nigrescens TaxID=381445 RepID=UPI000375DF03|nr:hypothetical protein [Amycolatopsis nigrescens]